MKNLKLIEDTLGVIISSRGNKVFIQGDEPTVERTKEIINELRELNIKGHTLRPEDISYAIDNIKAGHEVSIEELSNSRIVVSPKKSPVVPKTPTQAEYLDAIGKHDIVIGIGPAGTGKTYLAMAMAIHALLSKQVSRVVLARPAVEAGERLGYLPGDMIEKVTPYLRPLYDALYDMMPVAQANRFIEQGVIEIAPLAFMRGRTLNDSFIILDEAQNTTSEQMKMYLTRLGFNSKTVVTGDITQIDLPTGRKSGLVEANKILGAIEGIKIVYFSEKDVVRHRLVKKIVQAYEKYERKRARKK
jgi:phosphate starvation-inducible PhoH-like protein